MNRRIFVASSAAGIAEQVRAAIAAHALTGQGSGVTILAGSADGKSVELIDLERYAEGREVIDLRPIEPPKRIPPVALPFVPPGRSDRDQAAINEAAARRLGRNAKRARNAHNGR